MDKYVEYNLGIIQELVNRPIDYLQLYNQTKSNCQNIKMTRSPKNHLSIFGMFVPDKTVELCKEDYKGKLTDKEKGIDFKYYFDEQNRIILTERYPDRDNNATELIFYLYNGFNVEFVLFNTKRKAIVRAGRYEFGKDKRLSKYLEGDVNTTSNRVMRCYERLFSYDADFCIMTISSSIIFKSGRVSLRSQTVKRPLSEIRKTVDGSLS